jgi:hypothetical protein
MNNVFILLHSFVKIMAVVLIKAYKIMISPFKGYGCCRFFPSCSTYALQAFQHYPFHRACLLTVKRLGRCHPWGGHGEDPLLVLKSKKEKTLLPFDESTEDQT